jgi:hypothetical protein
MMFPRKVNHVDEGMKERFTKSRYKYQEKK